MSILICVLFDDGMSVSDNYEFSKKCSLQIQCDLLRAGLFPGLQKCVWTPTKLLDWVGLSWNFETRTLSIMERRIEKFLRNLDLVLNKWPCISFREISQLVGRLNSMYPVLNGKELLRARFLQTFINIKHYNEFHWDSRISTDFSELFELAKNELCFWKESISIENSRPFIVEKSTSLGWVDASSKAIGGIVFKMNTDFSAKIFSIDEILPQTVYDNSAKIMHVDYVRRAMEGIRNDEKYEKLKDYNFFHRMLRPKEISVDSNERELLAGLETVYACKDLLKGSVLTLHFDNQNAAKILKIGSSKPRLHEYALKMSDFCSTYSIVLNTVAIPRSINRFADYISKCVDYTDYGVTQIFFDQLKIKTGVVCNIDRFANNHNTKLLVFNSTSFCLGTSGVDAFNYDWAPPFVNWLFPPPDLILKTVNKLKLSKGIGLLLAPEWKSAPFYPYLNQMKSSEKVFVWTFKGKNIFEKGTDKDSFFGPDFNSAVNVWKLDFTN